MSSVVEILATGSLAATQTIVEHTFVNLAIAVRFLLSFFRESVGFTNMMCAQIRKPYVDALAAINSELERLSLTNTVDSLNLRMTHMNQLSKLKDDLMTEHKSELANKTQLHHEELSKVKMELSTMNASHAAELSRINSLHAAQLTALHKSHTSMTAELHKSQNSTIAELHKIHASTIKIKDQRYELLKATNIGLLLKQGPTDGNSVPGLSLPILQFRPITDVLAESVNRAETWRKVVQKNPGLQDLECFTLPFGAHIRDEGITDLQERQFGEESEMYAPVFTLLKRHLTMAPTVNTTTGDIDNRGCVVFDSHCRKNLSGRSPDMTISIGNAPCTDTTSMIGVFELKDGPLDDDAHGQVYDYIKLIKHKQLERTHFVGILSNIRENILMTFTRNDQNERFRCRTYKRTSLGYILSYLRELILHHDEYLPPRPKFSIGLGPMERRLGNPVFSVVAAFTVPRTYNHRSFKVGKWMNPNTADITGVMVVKRSVPATHDHLTREVADEINILRKINDLGGHRNLPKILYNCLDMQELAITPFGAPLKPDSTPIADWYPALNDILNALKWLHENHIIHRDVRWDNIIWDGDHAILIDLGASVTLTGPDMSVKSYRGGNICCPPRLIGMFEKEYTPLPADDCHAFVLLVSILLFPKRWTGVHSPDAGTSGSIVATMLDAYWTEMSKSKVWGRYVQAARNADYDCLREMLECFVYYQSPEISREDGLGR